MRARLTPTAEAALGAAIPAVQKAFQKQLNFLLQDLRHPSLYAKKYDERNDIWQARVNRDWRFYFQIQDDTYIILDIIPHPK